MNDADDTSAMGDLRKLRHAAVLAREGNFTRASVALGLTQSALTRSIQGLEAEFGLRLFDRNHSRVTPTPAGAMVLQRAQALLFQAASLIEEVAFIRDARLGALTFGASPFPCATLVAKALTEMNRGHPGLHIGVVTANSVVLHKHLVAEELEFYIGDVRPLRSQSGLAIQPLATMPLYFTVRAGHPLALRAQVAPLELMAFSLASPRFVAENLKYMGLRVSETPDRSDAGWFACDDMATLVSLTLNSDAVLLSDARSIEREVREGALITLPLRAPGRRMTTRVSIVKLAGRSLSPTAERLIGILRRLASRA
jgi:DNA-binding transcriptional LysR family regulator